MPEDITCLRIFIQERRFIMTPILFWVCIRLRYLQNLLIPARIILRSVNFLDVNPLPNLSGIVQPPN